MGVEGAEEDDGAAICILLDGYDTIGIGYMALWGFGAKCVSGVGEWMITSLGHQLNQGRRGRLLFFVFNCLYSDYNVFCYQFHQHDPFHYRLFSSLLWHHSGY